MGNSFYACMHAATYQNNGFYVLYPQVKWHQLSHSLLQWRESQLSVSIAFFFFFSVFFFGLHPKIKTYIQR